jgi:hypothetical protein
VRPGQVKSHWLSRAASRGPGRQIAVYDVSAAILRAESDEEVVIMPPRGASAHCWQLHRAMCGARRSAQLWQGFLATTFWQFRWRMSAVAAGCFYPQ